MKSTTQQSDGLAGYLAVCATRARPELRAVCLVALGMACMLTIWPAEYSPAAGPEPDGSVSPSVLDRAIETTLSEPEYAWRMPRVQGDARSRKWGIIGAFCGTLIDWIKTCCIKLAEMVGKLMEWLIDLFHADRKPQHATWFDSTQVRVLLFMVLALVACVLGIALFRAWQRRGMPAREVKATPVITVNELLNDDVVADQMPADEWMKLARECLGRGDFRLAIRAIFLSCLAYLGEVQLIDVARHKSNQEYLRELERHAHDAPVLLAAFAQNVSILERVWYGMHGATDDAVRTFSANHETIVGSYIGREGATGHGA